MCARKKLKPNHISLLALTLIDLFKMELSEVILFMLLLQLPYEGNAVEMRYRSPRALWFVRHGERIDNIDREWKETAKRWDDPYLSPRGQTQAKETGKALAKEKIDLIFTSPFTRCIQTMNGIIESLQSTPTIFVEPGLSESLNACAVPPGRPTMEEIVHLSPTVSTNYQPIYRTLPQENGTDEGCSERIGDTVRRIIEKYPTGNILFISHGSPVAASHLELIGKWNYVGQCTIGKIIESDSNGNQCFTVEKWGDKSHLSDQSNLHDVQSKEKKREERLPTSLRKESSMKNQQNQDNRMSVPA